MKVILCWNPNWSDMHLINKLMCADSFIFLILHQHSISITWTSSHKECYNPFLSDIICQAWLLHFSFEYSFSMLLKFDFKYTASLSLILYSTSTWNITNSYLCQTHRSWGTNSNEKVTKNGWMSGNLCNLLDV